MHNMGATAGKEPLRNVSKSGELEELLEEGVKLERIIRIKWLEGDNKEEYICLT